MNTKNTYTQSSWSLDDLFKGFDDPAIEATYQKLEAQVAEFEKYRSILTSDISEQKFMEMVKSLEAMEKLGHKIYGFAQLSFAADTQNQKALIALARIQQFAAELSNRTLFFSLWWKGLDDANAERLLAASGDYRYWLEQIRHFKPYTLSEPEEKVINIKNITGWNALNTLYDSITNRYVFHLEVDGETKELTRGELMTYVHSADPDLRARAYQELYRVYGNEAPILGQIYQNLVRDWHNENLGLRGFSSPISVRNLDNDIPDEVVDTLIEVTRQNLDVFQRYFKHKAKKLGVEKLRRYDIYAPVSNSSKEYSFAQAAELTFEAYERFDHEFAAKAQRVFADQHIDSEVRKGKFDGATTFTILPELTPWVMLKFQGHAEDITIMAHELGHAIHSILAEHHTLYTQFASLPLAETASTFGEMILTDLLLERETDPDEIETILFRQLDDAFANILHQVYLTIFERIAHERIAKGASVDELSELYLANLKEQFGEAVELSDEFKYEWICSPNIFSMPFYSYAYTFGQLLVLALYKRYKEEGESFKPKYMRILSAGGSVAPVKLLAEVGIDVTQAEFWQSGYDIIAGMVSRLESR